MKTIKTVSLILCLTLLANLILPPVYASDNDDSLNGDIIISDTYAMYYFEDSSLKYGLTINQNVGDAFFSVVFIKNPDFVYEYNFTTDVSSMDIYSTDYWNGLVSFCFDNSLFWESIYLPDCVEYSNNQSNTAQSRSTNSLEAGMAQWMEEEIGKAPYTGKVISTRQWQGVIFHLHEDLRYDAQINNSISIENAVSITTAIINLLQKELTSVLIDIVTELFGESGIIPAGTTAQTYYVFAEWKRYVKRRDSSVWLTSATQHFVTYDVLVNPSTGFFAVDPNTREEMYLPSQAYYEDASAQIEEGYAYYLTL